MMEQVKDAALTEIREGWVWPAADDVAFDHVKMYLPLLRFAVNQCKNHRVVVQAGGNAGMHPAILAPLFEQVLTFEPEPLNFQCLVENTKKFNNVRAEQAILGNRDKPVSLEKVAGVMDGELCVNTGAFRVAGLGDIPQFRIDDLGLEALDFIQLDVEGFELNALKGAEKSINLHSPVVMLESCNHGDDAGPFLEGLGYQRLVKGAYDHIYVRHHVS